MAWNAASIHFPPTSWVRVTPRPADVRQKVDAYFASLPPRPSGLRYERAYLRVKRKYTIYKSNPLHINDVIRQYPHPDRSPGQPWTSYGFRRKDEVNPLYIKQYVHNLKYGVYSSCKTPCTAATRSHVAKTPKFRLIWAYPVHITMAEGMFAVPLIRAFQASRSHYALWVNYAKGDLRRIMVSKPKGYQWLSTDWRAFDSRVPAWLIRDAFAILRENLDFSRYQEYGKPTHPESLPRLWKAVVRYFINTPIRLPSGEVKVKHQGVPSGSYFTSLVDSVCNALAMEYLLDGSEYRAGCDLQLGDDSLYAVRGKLSIQRLDYEAGKVFGFQLNKDKTERGNYVSFLGFRMSPQGYPLVGYDKLMAQLQLPAKRDQFLGDFVSRARALQLCCFGHGCKRFVEEVQCWLDTIPSVEYHLRPRDDLRVKLEALGLDHWPPLHRVMQVV
uniref:RdRp n=1 Tax=Wenling partiti-like virus 4 TaxID=1923522 RepID=A0A1L3KLV7_9VIRU|nr:RdRp [Wenling partiti-like virus 4]